MPRKTLNINPALDEKIIDYLSHYHMTYTSVITMALVKFFEGVEMTEKMKTAFPDLLRYAKDLTTKD